MIELAPHLRYGDFWNIEDDLLNQLLLKSSKLNHLLINNPRIEKLPEMDVSALQTFDCSYCHALTELLANMAELRQLDCSHCRALKELPTGMVKLRQLNCSRCIALKELPVGMVKLLQLCCFECLFTELPEDMHALEILFCFGCSFLTALPAGMVKLKTLDCSKCFSLIKLPEDMYALLELYCNECFALRSLPLELLSMRIFSCIGCVSLTMPRMPRDAVVISENSRIESTKFDIDRQELAKNPKEILKMLGNRFLLQNKSFPSICYYENGILSEGTGIGVDRDFVSRLIETLFKEASDSNHLTLENGFPLMDQNPNTVEAYRTLGILLALCYKDVSSFRTGPLFIKEVYECLALFPNDLKNDLGDLSEENLIALHQKHLDLSDNIAAFMNGSTNILLSEEDYVNLGVFLLLADLEIEKDALRQDFKMRSALREAFIDDAKKHSKLKAIYHIAKGIQGKLGQEGWSHFCQLEPEIVQKRIEGALSRELLLNKIKWNKTDSLSQEQLTCVQNFFNKWLKKADLEKVRKFLFGATGINNISSTDLNCFVYKRGDNLIPETHTCTSSVDFSTYTGQAEFDQKMHLFLTEGINGFQIR